MKQKNFLKILLLTCFTLCNVNISAQEINDNFDDGDITGWTESTAGHWVSSTTNPIIGTHSLKHNLSSVSGSSYISQSISGVDFTTEDATWQFNIKNGNWDPSSANKFWIYLAANEADLSSASVDGYAIGVNLTGSSDDITLWKVTNGSADEAVISTSIDWSANETRGFKVTRTSASLWEVLIDDDGGSDALVSKGTATNSDYTDTTAFGLSFTYSSSRAGLLWMDDILIEASAPSTDPIIRFDTAASSETETDITFTSSNIPITVSNYSDTQIDINVSITGGTAEVGDYTFTSPTALSFSANETQNIIFDINDDADTDAETIIFTITETSAVSGLVISQSTHTVTITDDEIPPVPVAGTVFITEFSDDKGGDFNSEFIELFNNSNETISLNTSKLIRAAADNSSEYVYDFGTDESTADDDVTIPAYGFIIITRGATRAEFDSDQGTTLNVAVKFNGGNTNLFFGSTSRRWRLMTGGTSNTDDGTLIDDTSAVLSGSRDYQNIFTDTFVSDSDANGTPGALEYLVYNGGAWVNTTAMDGTTAAKDAYIYDDYTVFANAAANNIGVNTGKTLTVNSSIGLDVDGNLTVNGNMSINSGGSLIVSGTSTGNVTYNRNLATTNWYLMSSPVAGETYDDAYVTANSIASGTGDNRGIALYTPSDDSWDYMQSGETATFAAGNGYSVKRSATGDISFTGTLNVADVGVTLSNAGNRFNLLGNPYTSHIASATFLTNEAVVSETQTLWVWNQATGASGAYEVKTISDAMVIAPAQGFFVKANAAGGTFNFAESNQASTGGTFQRTENRPEIYLTISNQTDAREAKIYYIENMTTGFDVGYEGELFNGVSNPLAIYTHLVADSEGKNYQVQSLPTNNYENMIVPVGVNATSGSAITIDASTNNLPEGVNIYLEDKQDNSFTLLNADTNFNSTLENDLSGIGRFYLYTTSESLSTAALGIDSNISIYKSSSDNIRIVGVQNGTANVQMYNMLGKEVLKTSFEGNGVNDIKLINISTGVYILKIALENGTINKKIIIQ